jgi:hypothetical protein
MTETTKQTKLRNVPHAEIQKCWLEDDSLTVEYRCDKDDDWTAISREPSWLSTYDYRLLTPKIKSELYHIAYQPHPWSDWKVSARKYRSVSDFESSNSPNFVPETPCILPTSVSEFKSGGVVVFTSYASK